MAGVITIMRNISALCLVAIVAHGVYAYDPRFTMLLIPPFLYYYHLNTPGWVEDLPVTRFMARMFGNVTDTYGSWAARIMFIVSGTMLGLFLGALQSEATTRSLSARRFCSQLKQSFDQQIQQCGSVCGVGKKRPLNRHVHTQLTRRQNFVLSSPSRDAASGPAFIPLDLSRSASTQRPTLETPL